MKRAFLIVSLLCVHASVFSQTDASSESRQLAREIVMSQDAMASLPNFFRRIETTTRQQLIDSVKRDYPNLTAAQADRVTQLYGDAAAQAMEAWMKDSLPKILDASIDLYAQRFSLQELQQLKNFHTSELGKKSIAVTIEEIPKLMEPLMKDASVFGATMGKRFAEINMQLEKEGFNLKKK